MQIDEAILNGGAQMSKFYITCLLIVIVFVPMLANAQDSTNTDESETTEYIVTADTANLRAEPNTSATIVGTVSSGDTLLIYDEALDEAGWLRVFQDGEDDAFIADFLVERAPMRFYPIDQEPIVAVSGRGSQVTDVYDFPRGAFRIDAAVEDRAFILQTVVVEGDCRDNSIFNELNFDVNRLVMSGLFVSSGCSILFQTDNVDGNWEFEVRDIIDPDILEETILEIEDGSSIAGTGRTLTMPTALPEGLWTIRATINDTAFILRANVLTGDCDDTAVLNEFDSDADTLELSTTYRNEGDTCVIFWETSNVQGSWEIRFEKLR